MIRLLLDANLSVFTANRLRETFRFDVVDLGSEGLSHLTDLEVVEFAKLESRVIVTFDLDFGEVFHRAGRGSFGVIVLRLADQTIESTNRVLERFFSNVAESIDLDRSL